MSQAIIDALGHDTETSHNSPKSLARIPLSFLPSEVIRAIYRWGPDSLTSVLTRGDKSIRMTGPAILVRVDDFPRWDLKFEDFVQFDSIMAHYEVPYILGVTPKCEFHRGSPRSLTVDELRFLHERVRENGIELALHGFTHQPRNFRGLLTEIATYSEAELRAQLIRMDMWFDSVRLPRPRVFVPPFNTFTQQNYVVLRRRFSIVTGGSSSLSTFGKFKPQKDGPSLYLPSYGHLYGQARQIRPHLHALSGSNWPSIITLHWAWEAEDHYRQLELLIDELVHELTIWSVERLMKKLALE